MIWQAVASYINEACGNVIRQEDGFEDLMKGLKGLKGPNLLETLVWKLSEFADDAAFPDDVSAVLYEFDPKRSDLKH